MKNNEVQSSGEQEHRQNQKKKEIKRKRFKPHDNPGDSTASHHAHTNSHAQATGHKLYI